MSKSIKVTNETAELLATVEEAMGVTGRDFIQEAVNSFLGFGIANTILDTWSILNSDQEPLHIDDITTGETEVTRIQIYPQVLESLAIEIDNVDEDPLIPAMLMTTLTIMEIAGSDDPEPEDLLEYDPMSRDSILEDIGFHKVPNKDGLELCAARTEIGLILFEVKPSPPSITICNLDPENINPGCLLTEYIDQFLPEGDDALLEEAEDATFN